MRPRYKIFFTVVLGLSAQSFGAEVATRIEPSTPSIDVVGEIDRQTPELIVAAVKQIRGATKATIFLRLDSAGGDIEAAIASGRLARKHEMFTIVPEDAMCASACALVFLGGVTRLVAGRFGIHRPYAIRYSDTDTDARRSYETINKITRDYLEHMNVSPRVLGAMNVVSPGDIKWLSKAERKELGIDGTDPVYEDRTDSAHAKRLGITKRELYERQQHAYNVCLPSSSGMSLQESTRCYVDIVEGRRR